MNRKSKIYIAGHKGLVGSAMIRNLTKNGFANLLIRTHVELDLTEQSAVNAFFSREKPDYVFLAAAKVGGIHANNTYPAEFIRDNLAIQNNVIHAAYLHGVRRLLFLGSSCIYPRDCPQPMKEEYLLAGSLEPTNRPYAVAKIAGIEMCWAYNRQYGTNFLAVMPTNLYGPDDNYHPENSHVIPALIRKFHEGRVNNDPNVIVWGTGNAKREFMYVDDMAGACVHLMNLIDEKFQPLLAADRNDGLPPLVNIGSGEDLTIKELAELVKVVVGYRGGIVYDTTRPDGTPRKLLDVRRLRSLGWQSTSRLEDGLALAYRQYQEISGRT
ncbi:MAG: GDP-L-fucose synthase [Nitrospirae bacterium]|nr:MAG: GDP-L-fucose synthase [Nitrospirota bacterium]